MTTDRDPGLGVHPPVAVLVVDDEPAIRRAVSAYLTHEGFEVTEASDGTTALDLARTDAPDVVVLDLMLPDIDGIEVCRRLRTFSDAYVVMLTARSEEVDALIGLSVGADDYLTKPFSPRMLVARIQTMLRRPRDVVGGEATARRSFGELTIDPDGREVTLAGEKVALTRTEFDILAQLSARPRHVHTRQQIVESVWGPSWVGDERLVDVHIAHLRAKLGAQAATRYVITVRGVGFRMGPG